MMRKAFRTDSPSRLIDLLWIVALFNLSQAFSNEEVSIQQNPELHSVRCDVKDLETTLRWNTTDHANDGLVLKRYIVRFCSAASCSPKRKLDCYEDDARTKKIRRLKETFCRASISEFVTFNTYYFEVTACYRNRSSSSTIKVTNSTQCDPITRQTSLSAPMLSTQSTKTSITITIKLKENLRRTLNQTMQNRDLSMSDVTYHYFLTPRGQSRKPSSRYIERKSLNNYETYENITPNEEYDIQGWYTIGSLTHEKSEVASTKERTKPDFFPQWAQIAVILATSSAIIMAMVTAILCNEYRKRHMKISKAKFRPTSTFELYLDDIYQATPRLSYGLSKDDDDALVQLLFTKGMDPFDIVLDHTVANDSRMSFEVGLGKIQNTAEKCQNAPGKEDPEVLSSGDYDRKSLQDYTQVTQIPA